MGTKYLEDDESILRIQNIKPGKHIGSDEIEPLTTQNPNTRLFIIPFSHLVYLHQTGKRFFDEDKLTQKIDKINSKYDTLISKNKSKKKKDKLQAKRLRKLDKKNKKLNEGNLLMRWGEELTVFDSALLSQTKSNITNYLFANGYFNSTIVNQPKKWYQLIKDRKKLRVIRLKIIEGDSYLVDSMSYVIQDPLVEKLFMDNISDQLLNKKQYSQDLITAERDRVYELMTTNGYFDFKRQYVLFEVDSTGLDNHRLIVRQTIANPPNQNNHKIFTLDSVIFTSNPNNSFNRVRRPSQYNNITYQLNNNRFYERVIDWRIFIYPDSLYNKNSTLETQKQLSYLDMFKFVNINHDTTDGKFIANIFTSPLQKYQTSIEGGLSIIDQATGWPGPFVNFNAKNRNIFKGLEILEFNGNASIQGINNVSKENANSRYSRLQYGGSFSLTFPQFLFPTKDSYQARIGQYNPKTKISLGINFEDRFMEYERTRFNTSMGYTWQVSDNSRLTFQPFDVGYILSNNSDSFKDQLKVLEDAGNISYVSAFKNSFVSSALIALDLNFNNYGFGTGDASFLHSAIEFGGLAQTFLGETPFKKDLNLTYYRYLKGNIDFRQNIRINRKTSVAYRANVGVAYVFGISKSLPYEKYYFAGGSNSIRAWQPRRLGPGNYAIFKSDSLGNVSNKVNYDREQPGDILIELSAEFRRDFIGIVDYALFLDAGNIWLWKSKTIESTSVTEASNELIVGNGTFKFNSFMSEMAVGAGAGLRLDFSFLVLRLDAAYKILDPAKPYGNRFVLDELNFKNLGPGSKMNLNIGIGYPF